MPNDNLDPNKVKHKEKASCFKESKNSEESGGGSFALISRYICMPIRNCIGGNSDNTVKIKSSSDIGISHLDQETKFKDFKNKRFIGIVNDNLISSKSRDSNEDIGIYSDQPYHKFSKINYAKKITECLNRSSPLSNISQRADNFTINSIPTKANPNEANNYLHPNDQERSVKMETNKSLSIICEPKAINLDITQCLEFSIKTNQLKISKVDFFSIIRMKSTITRNSKIGGNRKSTAVRNSIADDRLKRNMSKLNSKIKSIRAKSNARSLSVVEEGRPEDLRRLSQHKEVHPNATKYIDNNGKRLRGSIDIQTNSRRFSKVVNEIKFDRKDNLFFHVN